MAIIKTKNNTSFGVNDILVVQGVNPSGVGIASEYMRVTDITNAPYYTVTRDLAGSYSANNNPKWKAGSCLVKVGKSDGVSAYSGGFLRLIGEGANAPYYSVFARNGVAYNAYQEIIRMGNLNGIGGNVADTWGMFMGDYPNSYVQVNATGASVINAPTTNLMTIGETLTVTTPIPIFISTSDGKAYQCDDTNAAKLAYIGFLIESAIANESKRIQFGGIISGFSNLTIGSIYYLKNSITEVTQSDGIQNISYFGQTSGSNVKAGQTFLYTGVGTPENGLYSIKLKLNKYGTPSGSLYLKLYAADKTTLLATITKSSSDIASGGSADYTWTFSLKYELTPNTTYFLELSASTSNDDNCYAVYGSTTSTYSGGQAFIYNGTSWSEFTKDWYMYIYVNPLLYTSAGVNSVKVGKAISATQLLIYQLTI